MKIDVVLSKDKDISHLKLVKRTSSITNPDGTKVFEAKDLLFPESWSQVSVDIVAQKYFRRTGLPRISKKLHEQGVPEWLSPSTHGEQDPCDQAETSIVQVIHRLSGCWTYWGWKGGYFDTEQDALNFYNETSYMLLDNLGAPNSPQWFNTGLHWAYGIEGTPQGHYRVDPCTGKVVKSDSAYKYPCPHACYIQSVRDNLVKRDGIMDLWMKEARIFKYGAGTGSDFSSIRGKDEPLSGGGKSSGLLSFLKIGDTAAGSIKSGGTTRRAAKIVTLNVSHPDIEEFINWKVVEEGKVASLVAGSKLLNKVVKELTVAVKEFDGKNDPKDRFNSKINTNLGKVLFKYKNYVPYNWILTILQLLQQGYKDLKTVEYDTDWNGDAYLTVSGQNSNNSVRVNTEFMNAVERDRNWNLYRVTDRKIGKRNGSHPKPFKTLKARDLWNQIAYAAWMCADPGLQFDSTINEWHTCKNSGTINSSNPCAEYLFLDNTACNLASLNLLKFWNQEDKVFEVDRFIQAVKLFTLMLEISVYMAQFPSEEVARNSYDFRTLGLGYANLGALLMVQGIPYDSSEGATHCSVITALMTSVAYSTSALIASNVGPFPKYKDNMECMLKVIRNHHRAIYHGLEEEYEGLSILPMGIDDRFAPVKLIEACRREADLMVSLGKKYGYRNAQVTCIAPTGTIALVMGCDTTGIEPDFALVKFKKLAGGGYFKIINESVPLALSNLWYSRDQINDIVNYCKGHGSLNKCPHVSKDFLRSKGFTEEIINKIESQLGSTFDISFIFNKHTIGAQLLSDLGATQEQLANKDFSVLEFLGLSRKQIDEANDYICGTMTLEGAPHLSDAHLDVFDCASKCGKKGKRFICPQAHVFMLAAAQPYISGASSKTINMPNEATIEDIKNIYMLSWKSMVKVVALYRDGSKLSQPLNSQIDSNYVEDGEEDKNVYKKETAEPKAEVVKIAEKVVYRYLTQRRKLPSRRNGYTQKVVIGGHDLYLRTGEYEDGSLGEVFLDIHKEGVAFRSMVDCFAIAISLGLQYGIPLEKFVETFRYVRFEPNGIVQEHDHIKMTTSIVDYVFKELALNYLDQESVGYNQSSVTSDKNAVGNSSRDNAVTKGYEDYTCSKCGQYTIKDTKIGYECDTCGNVE